MARLVRAEGGDSISGLTRRPVPHEAPAPVAEVVDHPLLAAYKSQVSTYYSLPQEIWAKRDGTPVFSPSEVAKCPRELYYAYTHTTPDPPKPRRPVQARIPDVGNGLHAERQRHLKKMPDALTKAGEPVRFRVKVIDGKPAIETTFEREFTRGGVTFKIRGRLDGIIEFLDDSGAVIGEAVLDWKIKTLKKKLAPKAVEREVEKYVPQMVAYKAITDIPIAIIDLESAQKDWSKDLDDGDVEPRLLEISDEQVAELLDKLAMVTHHVKTRTLPEREYDDFYCKNFCPFFQTCDRDTYGKGEAA